MMLTRNRLVVVSVLAVSVLAGACQYAVSRGPATGADVPSRSSTSTTWASVGRTSSPTPTARRPSLSHPPVSIPAPPLPTPAPSSPPSSGGGQTFIGTAYQGAEPGCVGLRVGNTSYELTGKPVSRLPQRGYGQTLGRVRVVGHFARPTLVSHCMMGRIVVVDTLTKL